MLREVRFTVRMPVCFDKTIKKLLSAQYEYQSKNAWILQAIENKLEKDNMTSKKKWIQAAIKKPGALHKEMGIPKDKKIPAKKLEAAAKKGGKEGKRARLAEALKKMFKK